MKKLSLIGLLLCLFTFANAQSNLKIGLSNLAIAQANFEYENVFNDQFSAMGEITFNVPLSIPRSFFERIESAGTNNNIRFDDGTLSGFSFGGEFRYYVKGEAPEGFYVSPYLRFNNNKFKISGTYDNSNNINVDAAAEVGLFTASIGGGIGYQWLLADKVTLNWNIVGIGIGRSRISGSFTATDNGTFSDYIADVENYIDLIPLLPNINVLSDNLSRTVTLADSFWVPTVRANLSVGFMF
jgi:hypothetical protein